MNSKFRNLKIEVHYYSYLKLLEILNKEKIKAYNLYYIKDYRYELEVSYHDYLKLKKLINDTKIISLNGLYYFLKKYLFNPYYFTIYLISLTLFNFYNHLTFDIIFLGNYHSYESLIKDNLKSYSIEKYKILPSSKKIEEVKDNLRIELFNLVEFIDIEIKGNNIYVYYLKRREKVESEREKEGIIALKRGMVHSFEVEKGDILVSIGQIVERGQLLISGYVYNEDKSYYVGARGKVYGICWYTYEVSEKTNLNELESYLYLLEKINRQVILDEDEKIINQKVLKYQYGNISYLKVHFTLLEDITR